MRRIAAIVLGLAVIQGCSEGDSVSSDPGPLTDNLDWVPTTEGEEFFGPAVGVECPLEPEGDCPPMGEECVTLPPGCVVSHVAERLEPFCVLAVYTRRPDNTPLCNWLTLRQETLRPIRRGDEVEARFFHDRLNAPFGGEARISLVIGEDLISENVIAIPQDFQFFNESWIATRDYPAGTPILFHVDNHGANEYGLVEVNVCEREPGSDEPCFLQ